MASSSRLQLLTGRAGTGKTSICLRLFREQILRSGKAGLDQPSFFILPSKEHGERIRGLLLRDRRFKGVLNFHVLTINDFIRLKVARGERRSLSHFERAWLVRRVLEQGGWGWLGPAAGEPGLPYLLADFIREVKSARIGEDAFERAAQGGPGPGFAAKAADLVRLLRAYDAACREAGLADPEDEIARYASDLLASGRRSVRQAHRKPAFDFVIFDGFFGFTQAQLLFIEAVAAAARGVTVTLTLDKTRADSGVFHYPLKMRERLLGLGFRERRLPAGQAGLSVQRRFRAQGLAALEERLFSQASAGSRLASARFSGTDPSCREAAGGGAPFGVEIFCASGVRQEMEMVAREILDRQRRDGFYFSDFMVVLRDVPPYRRAIEEVFGSFGIPVEIHERKRLSENPFIRFVLDWMAAFSGRENGGFDLKRWRALLRCTYLGLGPSAMEGLEAVGREALRLRSVHSTSLRTESRATSRGSGQAAPVSWDDWKAAAASASLSPETRTELAALLPWADEILSLDRPSRGFWGRFIDRWTRGAGDGPEAAEERYCAAKLREALEDLPPGDWRERLSGWLERGLYSMPVQGKNRVQVYGVSLSLAKEYRVVFVSGLAQAQFPRTVLQDPVLKDAERERLDPSGDRFDTVAARACGERYYFYMAATRARDRLTFTYPSSDAEGRELLPSFFLDEVTRAIGPVPVRTRRLVDVLPPFDESIVRRDALGTFCYSAFRPEKADDLRDAALVLGGENPEDSASLLDDLRREEGENSIRDARVLKDFKDFDFRFSTTRLSKLDNCGYQHFADYLLGLGAAADPTPPMQDGNILHKTLENVYRRLFSIARGPLPEPEAFEALLIEEFETVFPLYPVRGERFYLGELRKAWLRGALSRFARSETAVAKKRPAFVPAYFEWSFGAAREGREPDAGPLVLERAGERLEIVGYIDRIDLSEDGRALVIDYKKSHDYRYADLKEGAQLQAPVYIWAVSRLLRRAAAGMEFISLSDEKKRRGVYKHSGEKWPRDGVMTGPEFGSFLAESENKVFDLVRKLKSADIRAEPRSCSYCDYGGLCRIESWRARA